MEINCSVVVVNDVDIFGQIKYHTSLTIVCWSVQMCLQSFVCESNKDFIRSAQIGSADFCLSCVESQDQVCAERLSDFSPAPTELRNSTI